MVVKTRKGPIKEFGGYSVLKVVILIGVAVMMIISSQSTRVAFLNEGLKIRGMYGEVYRWETIDSVKQIDELPTIERRTNGSAVGSKLRGHFRTKEMGSVKLFVNTQKPPFIYIEADGRIAIFNLKDSQETIEAFRKLTERIEDRG